MPTVRIAPSVGRRTALASNGLSVESAEDAGPSQEEPDDEKDPTEKYPSPEQDRTN